MEEDAEVCDRTADSPLERLYLGIRIVDDFVHSPAQVSVLVGHDLTQVLLVCTANCKHALSGSDFASHISCAVWYDQKARALPAHSMMVVGSRPLRTLVL